MKAPGYFVIIIFSLTLLSSSCKKHVLQPVTQLSLLPPATQTGANTFGCLVNGQAFLPGGNIFSGSHYQCNYIYTAGGFYFTVEADNQDNNGLIKQVFVRTQSLAIIQSQSITLKNAGLGNADALYAIISSSGNDNAYATGNIVLGVLTITKLDTIKQIVSGTFYFNATNVAGDTVKITDGRFDMLYTR